MRHQFLGKERSTRPKSIETGSLKAGRQVFPNRPIYAIGRIAAYYATGTVSLGRRLARRPL